MEENTRQDKAPQDNTASAQQRMDVPLAVTDPEQDGRNKEWQDRARVNLETVPEGTTTNLERDFEPEHLPQDDVTQSAAQKPAY